MSGSAKAFSNFSSCFSSSAVGGVVSVRLVVFIGFFSRLNSRYQAYLKQVTYRGKKGGKGPITFNLRAIDHFLKFFLVGDINLIEPPFQIDRGKTYFEFIQDTKNSATLIED